jgi:hypothetical protein
MRNTMNELEEMREKRKTLIFIEGRLLDSILVDITVGEETSPKVTYELFRVAAVIAAIDEHFGPFSKK